MKRISFVVMIMLALSFTAWADGKVVSQTFDDCEQHGLKHSWVYSTIGEGGWSNITDGRGFFAGGEQLVEIPDKNAEVTGYEKILRVRKCRNCNLVEELHVSHQEKWRARKKCPEEKPECSPK